MRIFIACLAISIPLAAFTLPTVTFTPASACNWSNATWECDWKW
jgi:hypothetical protein